MSDDITIIPPALITDDNVISVNSGIVSHEVEIISVEDVSSGNRRQAEATMRALAEAGLDLELAARGLEEGHGHNINKMVTNQKFQDMENKVGGISVSHNSVAAWQLESKRVLGSGKTPSGNSQDPGLVIYQGVGLDIEKVDFKEEIGSKRIKMVVVMGTKIAGEIEEEK